MTRKLLFTLCATVLMSALLMTSAFAARNTKADIADGRQFDRISTFNVGPYPMESRDAVNPHFVPAEGSEVGLGTSRQPLGSAQSTNVGMGPGVSIDLTWADEQWGWGTGRQVETWWNGASDETMEVSVHFVYLERPDTIAGYPFGTHGYNVYDAAVSSSNWPRGQDIGCDLQIADTLGYGPRTPSLALTHDGRAVIAGTARHWRSDGTGARVYENYVYYQGSEFNCTYDPRSALNVTWLDSNAVKGLLMDNTIGAPHAGLPTLASQWDGTSTIIHLGAYGYDALALTGNDYCEADGQEYFTYVYFRKVGSTSSGTWSSGQIIDSIWFGWNGFAAAPYPHTGVAITYTNPTYYGCLLDVTIGDMDVWCRESFDRGLTWPAAYSVTNYTNAIAGDPNHFTAWLEAGCMFDSEGDLHVWWTAKPTSADPYFDGFNWNDFDENVYHWEKTNGNVVPGSGYAVKVANGNFMNDDMLTGSMNTFHCGFGGSNAGYLGWIGMGECDGKLYMLWSQIHERANRFPWRDAATQPAPGVLDDCSYNGARLGRANWELMMSVAQLSSSTLWDAARNLSNTYTPNCGLPGDPLASGLCGSEWKVAPETYALDETGLDLTWPDAAIVDVSPAHNYAGGWYLNLEYMDDRYPGPYNFSNTTTYNNPPATENSEKWIRLACVEPIEASQIDVNPESIEWPQWVPLGQTTNFTVTVVNDGNVTLNVTEIGDNRSWLSHNVTSYPFQVTAGVVRTRTFTVSITAPASPTQWLDGELWVKSDAANSDSVPLHIHVLAATDVEAVAWDTVTTHQSMFDEFFDPEGACVALAVGNNGDLGWGAGSAGSVNLDYTESGLECGTRARDQKYLSAASVFTIMASSTAGASAELTQVTNDANQADETGFDPTPAKVMSGGSTATYDSVYTGKFVNRDTTIAFERIVYGPRSTDPTNETINFVVVHTWVYSADGAAHNHVTIGNVADWDIPADAAPNNTAGVSGSGFVYLQGTDTTGHNACQNHTARFATEAFGGGYTKAAFNLDPCVNDENAYYSVNALNQLLMVDTTHYRDGTDLVPDQPNPLVWWTETGVPGLNANDLVDDQAVWLTYKHDYNLAAADTLHFWTVMSTVRNGSLSDLEAQVTYAKCWYKETVRGCLCNVTCCVGKIGDANGSGEDMPTIGDISVMIDAKFITGDCITEGAGANIRCIAEADANVSGGATPTCEDISIGDISMLIDCLFITGEPPFVRNNCAQ